MAKKNIEDVYNNLYKMGECIDQLIELANTLVADVAGYGGDLKRVITEQMAKYFIPTIQALKEDENTPGCVKAQITYLDSIPLWQTRVEADPAADYQPDPETAPAGNVNMPASSTVGQEEELPRNVSYQNPEGLQESFERYRVVRIGQPSELGAEVGNVEPTTIFEYDTEEEANEHCAILNDMISNAEKEALGTTYEVVKMEYEDGIMKPDV